MEQPGRGPSQQVVAVVAVVIGVGALVAVTLVGRAGASIPAGVFAVDITIGVVAVALLPALVRWPVPTAIVLAALAVFSPAATPAATVGTLFVAERRPLGVAIRVGVVGVLAHVLQGLLQPTAGLSYGWWVVLVVVAHAALVAWGALGRARRELLASLRERARRAEAEQAERIAAARAAERTVIAREMHDVLAHRLSLVATYAGALEYRPDSSPEQLSRAAGVVRAGVHQALDELREVIGVLRAGPEPGDPEHDRPQPGITDLPGLLDESRAAGAHIELDDRVAAPTELPEASGRTAYRIVQEALTNARRHAPGEPVRVRLDGAPGAGLSIDVRNPLPTVVHTPEPSSGTGLIGLAERAQLAGGRLDHETTAAGEFRLHAALPWPA